MRRQDRFLTSVLQIALPVACQSMLQSSFSMIDQLMVGQLGSVAVAAVEVASRPAFIYSVVVGAVAAIAGIMIAQYIGQDKPLAADRSLSVNLAVAIGIALVFMAFCLCLPEPIVRIYTNDEKIVALGTKYLTLILFTYLSMGIATILSVMIRCMDYAVYPMAAGLISALINTTLNYLFIFGHFGAPNLGVTGAAVASVISQLGNLLIVVALFIRIRRKKALPFHFSLDLDASGFQQYLLMLLPILINEFLWSVGQNVNTFIYGHIGTDELAAMSITGPVQGIFIGAMSGIAQAAGILIGKRLGAEEYDMAYGESKRLMWYGLLGSLLLSAMLILLRNPYTQLFQVEDNVRQTAGMLLFIFAVLAPVKVANMILGGGIVRSGGKTGYIMAIDTLGTWAVGVPLGLISAFLWHLPIVPVYFILSQEELVRLVITIMLFRRKSWMNRL